MAGRITSTQNYMKVKTWLIYVSIIATTSCSDRNTSTANVPSESNTGASATPEFTLSSVMKCEQTQLSKQFDLVIEVKRYSDEIKIWDSCGVKILIRNKLTKAYSDSILLSSVFFAGELFGNCDSMVSYTTKINIKRQIVDNMFGDIIVADVNFDNRDDIVVIREAGSNSGPLYKYFIQSGEALFRTDKFLTDSVAYFPDVIDSSKWQLITRARAGACCVSENIYQLDKSTREWKKVGHKMLGENSAVSPAN